MSRQTLSIKFVEGGSQATRLSRLGALCSRLVAEGLLSKAQAQAVFPDDPDPEMAALFTVDVIGKAVEVLPRFRQIDGVAWVQKAAERRALTRTAPAKVRSA